MGVGQPIGEPWFEGVMTELDKKFKFRKQHTRDEISVTGEKIEIWEIPEKPELAEVDMEKLRGYLGEVPANVLHTLPSLPDLKSRVVYLSTWYHPNVAHLPPGAQECLIDCLLAISEEDKSASDKPDKSQIPPDPEIKRANRRKKLALIPKLNLNEMTERVVRLFFEQDCSGAEIARRLERDPSTIRYHLNLFKKKCDAYALKTDK